MNGNCTASAYAEPPFIYGQILQRSLYLAQLEKQTLVDSALAIVDEEIRYYLID